MPTFPMSRRSLWRILLRRCQLGCDWNECSEKRSDPHHRDTPRQGDFIRSALGVSSVAIVDGAHLIESVWIRVRAFHHGLKSLVESRLLHRKGTIGSYLSLSRVVMASEPNVETSGSNPSSSDRARIRRNHNRLCRDGRTRCR